ncbi:phosphoribosyl-AMP cyclohydrolase [Tepidamorphus gemmatus]|uniref:Phosphoribosyl-AMP cyclohydrolase n=1 Tax=Tepidamorphus gemmatus TaxID=747076 RepID=A0A4R3MFX6_9HYPH|nr:phosphoribosyl-AMP cyclohydrolase [Tepidamorphus gemmatus]TCT12635.1 phosphoribosyl-AMP cyclohydrolase [Tepidamorphus gemmatus]
MDSHFPFPAPGDKQALETSGLMTPRFGADGLVTCVVTDADDGEVLMLAHMNAEALALSIETGIAHYWSRSRQELWRKGDTSGSVQSIVEMRIDCDQDAVWIKVRVGGSGASCHTGRRSCFYRIVETGPIPAGGPVLRDGDR